jgi:type II secretory pathway pseudopilin PulG
MNPIRSLHNQRGATLMVVLVIVVVMGLMLGMAGRSWKSILQKEREEELLFRGEQYRRAIESYFNVAHGGKAGAQGLYPNKLEDLLKDPRSAQTVRHLRRIYKDPMTGDDFELVQGGGEITGLQGVGQKLGGIRGVRSTSGLEPFRTAGFQKPYEKFNNATAYNGWEFTYEPERLQGQQPPGTPVPGPGAPPLPGTLPPTGGSGRPGGVGGDPFR